MPAFDEQARLEALAGHAILDTPPEPAFDRVAALVADVHGVPAAFLAFVGDRGHGLKASVGVAPRDAAGLLPLSLAVVHGEDDVVCFDPEVDARLADARSGASVHRFFAGVPVTAAGGARLGALCILDHRPRADLARAGFGRLTQFAQMVADQLILRKERLRSEEARRLLGLAESVAGLGTWRHTVADQDLVWSDEVYRIHGVSRATFRPRLAAVLALYRPDDRARIARALDDTRATKGGFELELRVGAGATERRIVAKGTCELDDAGRVTALFGIVQDITARAVAAEALAESEARYRFLAEHARDVIVRIGTDGVLRYLSPAARTVLGRREDDLVGRFGLDLVHAADRRAVRHRFGTLVRRGRVRTRAPLAFRVRDGAGAWRWVESRASAVVDPGTGAVAEFVDVLRDIGERKTAEAELRDARRKAEAATAAQSAYLADASHELRTPLNSILGFVQLLRADPDLRPDQERRLAIVDEAGRNLLAIVTDVLDLAKLETGRIDLRPTAFRPDRLVEALADSMSPQVVAKGLELVVEVDAADAEFVRGDVDRLRQVLLNLVSNAVKFTHGGRIWLRLRTGAMGPDVALTFEVEDTGIGIEPEQVGRLFRRFAQADSAVAGRYGGFGLGLAISKALVEAMRGRIEIESRPGSGSRFTVRLTLPRASPSAAGIALPPRRGVHEGSEPPRILVAEDVGFNQELVRAMLSSVPCGIDFVWNGEDAVTQVQAARYDLVLMDLEMPKLDGLVATRRIRALGGRFADLPIVALTANAFPEHLAACRAAGMVDAIAKPFSPRDLLRTVSRWLNGRGSDAARTAGAG